MIIKLADGTYENVQNWRNIIDIIRKYCGDELARIVEEKDVPDIECVADISMNALEDVSNILPGESWVVECMEPVWKAVQKLRSGHDENAQNAAYQVLLEEIAFAKEKFVGVTLGAQGYIDRALQEIEQTGTKGQPKDSWINRSITQSL